MLFQVHFGIETKQMGNKKKKITFEEKFLLIYLMVAPVVLGLYVLSAGPVVAMSVHKSDRPSRFVMAVYAPLLAVTSKNKKWEKMMDNHINSWIDDFNKE